ncbi:MAG: CarD family transcriptional regulator, partial [Desulfobacterota bacterium]|nr:CarD family transcriptional regulator [Thermodesulfobacteriota bacterium]
NTSFESQAWNRRYREYMNKIKTGSPFEIAQVFRDLVLLKMEKELSFGEKRILDMARNLLVKELSIAQNRPEENIRQHLEEIFNA